MKSVTIHSEIQTPKLVTKKKIHAPKSAPEILKLELALNSCETKPIINTLPSKKVPVWYPIIKSVIAKLINTAGISLNQKIMARKSLRQLNL